MRIANSSVDLNHHHIMTFPVAIIIHHGTNHHFTTSNHAAVLIIWFDLFAIQCISFVFAYIFSHDFPNDFPTICFVKFLFDASFSISPSDIQSTNLIIILDKLSCTHHASTPPPLFLTIFTTMTTCYKWNTDQQKKWLENRNWL